MLPTYAAQCIERQPPADSALLLERLGSQESVAVLRHLPNEHREAVLNSLGPQWVMAFKLLLSYPTNTVGAWVEPRVLTLPDDCTVGEARDRIARSEQVDAGAHLRARSLAATARRRARPRAAAGVEPQEARRDPRARRRAVGARPARHGARAQRLGAPHRSARRQPRRRVHRRHLVRRPAQSVPPGQSRRRAATAIAKSPKSPSSSPSAPAACGAASAI